MHDVLGQVALGGGDEALDAGDVPRAVVVLSGLGAARADVGAGGTPAPSSLTWAIGEMVLGANAPIWMYGAGPAFASVVHRNGNERDKLIAQHIIDRGWLTTMVLTEPDAGSDVGAG
ncbi:MAG: hypothetical protein L0H93_22775, partial [Nocardioides sp.]|nr:hypothetical protein [Nocardioides sp.]